MTTESYDDRIDWESFYRQRIDRARKSGDKITGLCPFHENTRTPAFWANLGNGMWKCEAGCGSGNATSFLARKEGIDTKQANAMLLKMAGIEPAAAKREETGPYTLERYASEKGLDIEQLRGWGLETGKRGSASWVTIPYRDASGEVTAIRKRNAPDASPRFAWVKGAKMSLYGLWLMEGWEADAPIVLVEGESDCHALWTLGIPALGVAGATTFRAEWSEVLKGRAVYLHDEGDAGARAFIERTAEALRLSGHTEPIRTFASPDGCKDPSDVLSLGQDKAKGLIEAALAAAEAYEPTITPDGVDESTWLGRLGLRAPQGWHCDERGIARYDEDRDDYVPVTATPIVLRRRIIDVHGAGERVEVAFMRDGKWTSTVASRDDAFATRNVVTLLAPLGAAVTSENARLVVRWLGALEAANMETLGTARSSRQLGWVDKHFLPVTTGDVVLDVDDSAAELIGAFQGRGSLEAWVDAMRVHREQSPVFRFMLAAGLASTMLRAVQGRIFFVYNWGDSKGGKTAAIKAALSAWGDPDLLMTTWNATSVGLERMAGLMRDLPLGVDERQMAGGDQKRLDQMVYTLASGTGRIRGARDGGLQATQHWRCVVIATGEEPLTGSTSQTGVSTRVLELFGRPFLKESDAADMHILASENHGHAGPLFVERVVALGDEAIRKAHGEMVDWLRSGFTDHASSHISGVALVALADAYVSEWLYGASKTDALADAKCMALAVLGNLDVAAARDIDEVACDWLVSWLRSNHHRFEADSFGDTYGQVDGDIYHVLSAVLNKAIEDAGFSSRKTLRALDAREAICEKGVRDGSVSLTRTMRVHGRPSRVVSVDVGVLVGERVVGEVKGAREAF